MALTKKGMKEIVRHTIYGFDTETYGIEDGDKNGRMYMAWVTTPTESFYFDDQTKLIDFFKNLSGDIWIVGHNVRYDLNTMFPEWNPKMLEWSGSFVNCETYEGSGVFFVDLFKFLQKSEKEIAKDFGFTYIDEHFRHEVNIKEACKSHAEVGRLVLTKIQDIYIKLGGQLKFTASSAALELFIRQYIPYETKDYVEKKSDLLKLDCYMSYHGGATEIFRKGKFDNVIMLDVASMYPSQMLKTMPDLRKPKRYSEYKIDQKKFNEIITQVEGCVCCSFIIPKMLIAPFIYEDVRSEKRILSHTGRYFKKWITFPEYKYIIKLGAKIEEIVDFIYFPKYEGFFTKFINSMWEYKQNPETKGVAKLNMNGLSGKFGQHNEEDSEFFEIEEGVEVDINECFSYGSNEDIVLFKNIKKEFEYEFGHKSYPIISSYICAYARIYLHETMCKFGQENIIYCDTDSIAVINHTKESLENILGYKLKNKDTDLGNFELQWQGTMEPRALKYYRYKEVDSEKWNYKIKGLPKNKQEEFWISEKATVQRPRSRRVAIRTNKPVNAWFEIPYVSKNKTFKRIFHEDGTSESFHVE